MRKREYTRKGIVLICVFFLLNHEGGFSQQADQKASTVPLCGPYALMITAKAFGIDVSISSISHLAKTTDQGTSMKGLADAANQVGLKARGMKLSHHELVKLKPPIIAHVNSNHYLVIEQILDDKLRVVEIDKPSYLMSFSEFEKIWDGYVLIVSPKQKENSENQPNIQVDQFIYDFGISNQGKYIEHTFSFKNTGNGDLVIRDVLPGCTCSAAKVSKKIIPPGGQAELFMSLNIEARWGEVGASADVISNDPDQPIVTFTIKGIAKTVLPIEPKEIELGRIMNENKRKPIQRIIQIQDPGVGNLVIKKAKTSSNAIQAKIFQEKKGEDAEIHLLIIPDECSRISPESRRFEEYVTIYTNDDKSPQVDIPIRGEIAPVIQVVPERFFFGFVKKGKSISQSVTMTDHEQGTLEILKVETDLKSVSVEVISVTPGQEYRIDAKFQSSQADANILQGKVTVYTNHSKQPIIGIPVYAIVQ